MCMIHYLGKFLSQTSVSFFFFNDTATTEIYTLSLHDALPIYSNSERYLGWLREACEIQSLAGQPEELARMADWVEMKLRDLGDRKSTRLNSSHANISYAVFCLKKKQLSSNDP